MFDDEMMQGLLRNCVVLLEVHNDSNERKLPPLDRFTQDDVNYVTSKHLSHFAQAAVHLNPTLRIPTLAQLEAIEKVYQERRPYSGHPYPHLSKAQQEYHDSRYALTYDQLLEAYDLWQAGDKPAQLARQFNTSPATMQRLLYREHYRRSNANQAPS
jgi:hypothetical protein